MNAGERHVWAGVFVHEFLAACADPPAFVMNSEKTLEEFEIDAAENAAEIAEHAVKCMRLAQKQCEENFGMESDVTRMLNIMLGLID
jgi:hypothetical protein